MTIIRSLSSARRLQHSMQYYRVWIYACNVALGVTSAVFVIFAAFFLGDIRLSLLGGVELYHPTFLYAYLALVLQCGVVQTIGCLGARRLSHKLLSIYWILLLLLTIGDVVVGLVWIFRLKEVKGNLSPELTREFITKYSKDDKFTATWNMVQSEEHCCGVEGPLDYDKLSGALANSSIPKDASSLLSLPESCCIVIYEPNPVLGSGGGSGGSDSFNKTYRHTDYPSETEFSISSHYSGEPHSPLSVSEGELQNDGTAPPGPEKSSGSGNLPLNNSNDPIIFKHKLRHGAHRLKFHANESSPEDDTLLHHSSPSSSSSSSDSSSSPPPLLEQNKNKSKTKSRPSKPRKSFPSFYFSLPSSKGNHQQADAVEKLALPFTCSKHFNLGKKAHDEGEGSSGEFDPRRLKGDNDETGDRRKRSSDNFHHQHHHHHHHPSKDADADAEGTADPSFEDDGVVEDEYSSSSPEIQATGPATYYLYPTNSTNGKKYKVYHNGCEMKLRKWVDRVSSYLFIIGFCIIGFIKAAFLIILRTEIGEMIEKIQILELEDPVSPSRAHNKEQRLRHVPHPLLSHPHRASTVSAHAYNAALPTIKSPEGSGGGGPARAAYQQRRRHSNIIGDRGSTHSQETVNMTLLVNNNAGAGAGAVGGGPGSGATFEVGTVCTRPGCSQDGSGKGKSNPNLSNFLLDFDPVAISVPNTAKYLRRSSTCSASAHIMAPCYGGHSSGGYDELTRAGPSWRFYNQEPPHYHGYHGHGHCSSYQTRPKLYTRNMSIGAVTHYTNTSGAPSSAFKSFTENESGNCSFSSRDENEITSVSMENVVVEPRGGDTITVSVEQPLQLQRQESNASEGELKDKERERRQAEIRDWAACASISTAGAEVGGEENPGGGSVCVSLGDYTKLGFNHSSDSSNSGGRKNGNNNVSVDLESIPIAYLGTAV